MIVTINAKQIHNNDKTLNDNTISTDLNINFWTGGLRTTNSLIAPNVTKYEKVFDKEVSMYNKEIKKRINNSEQEQALNSPDFKKQPENIQIITKAKLSFLKALTFSNNL